MPLLCDRIVTAGILFLILATPFAFGTVHPWAYSTMEAIIFALVIVWMLKLAMLARQQGAKSKEQGAMSREQRAGSREPAALPLALSALRLAPLALPLALFVALALFQLVPLPPSWLRVLSPATFAAYTQILPGWPERAPYGELSAKGEAQRAEGQEPSAEIGGQRSEVRNQTTGSGASPLPLSSLPDSAPSSMLPSPSHSPLALSAWLPTSLLPAQWRPLSLAPALGRTDLLQLLAYAALFFLIWGYPVGDTWQLTAGPYVYTGLGQVEEKFNHTLLFMVLITGLLVAAVGFVERFSWNGKILWSFVPYDWGEAMANGVPRASGPFINPDHYGNYLALIFPIALTGVLFRVAVVGKSLEHPARIFSGVTVLLILTGILLSLSRGAWIGSLCGTVVLLGFMPWQLGRLPEFITRRGFTRVRVALMVLCVLLIGSLFFIGTEGRDQVDARLGETMVPDVGLGGRIAIWRDSPAMVRDFPFFGVGLGAWPELFLHYRGGPWSRDFFREAHNDYLQLLAETGVVGFALLAWFFIAGGRRFVRGLRRASAKNRPVMAAIVAALAVMALHEFLDFNLQIPANAFLFTLLLALGLRLAGGRERSAKREGVRAKGQELGAGSGEEDGGRATGDGLRSSVFGLSSQSSERGAGSMEPDGGPETEDSPRSSVFGRPSPVPGRLSLLTPSAISVLAIVLLVCAVNQEQIPYPYNLREPNAPAEAHALVLAHPTHAPYHLALLRLAPNTMPLSWQINAAKAALWIEPTNPYLRDLYAALLMGGGDTDGALQQVTLSVANSPSLTSHVYLADNALQFLSAAEQAAVEEGFKHALARGYPAAPENLAGFYAKLDRFSEQAAVYEQAARHESDSGKKADLLIAGGLAYLKAAEAEAQSAKSEGQRAGSMEQGAGSGEQGAKGQAQSAGSKEQGDRGRETGDGPRSSVAGQKSESKAQSAKRKGRDASPLPLSPSLGMQRDATLNAERLLRAAIAVNPSDAKGYQQLMMIFAGRKDLAGAKKIIAMGIANGAPTLLLQLALAEAAHRGGSAEETQAAMDGARAEVERLARNGADSHAVYLQLADGARKVGDRAAESAALGSALEQRPQSTDTLTRLAHLSIEQRKFDRAALYLRRVTALDPDSASSYFQLAVAEEGRYHFPDAGKAYARAVQLAPDNHSYRQRYEAFRERVAANAPKRDPQSAKR